jgi:CRISPR-associated endonuclease/helicase Cas3
MEKLYIDGLGIKETDEPLVGEWNCYQSQREARKAFRYEGKYSELEEEGGVLLNDNTTGAGKTFTWLDPVIRCKRNAIVMYPTNALIDDQYNSICGDGDESGYLSEEYYGERDNVAVLKVNAAELQKEGKKRDNLESNGEILECMIQEKNQEGYESVIILTNPDIFTQIRQDIYNNGNVNRVIEKFDTVVVDEFHHASPHGKSLLINLMEQLRESPRTNTEIGMLLSATPDRKIMKKLENSSAPIYNIADYDTTKPLQEIREDGSCNVINPSENNREPDKDNYQVILPRVEAIFKQGQTFQVGNKMINNIGNIVKFCTAVDKTVIMLDSQKEVSKLATELDNHISSHTILQVDGKNQMQKDDKITKFNEELDKAIMVSNSAVEVGIDFETDRIIFSGTSPARMLQRFGRLRNKAKLSKALIYCPHAMLEYASNRDTSRNNPLTRESFANKGIERKMRDGREPSSYLSHYGAHAAYRQAIRHKARVARNSRAGIMERARDRVRKFFFEPYYPDSDVDWDEFERRHKNMGEIMESLNQFRSGSPSLLVYDNRPGYNELKTHQIQSVIRAGDVTVMDESDFIDRIPDHLEDEVHGKKGYTCGFVEYRGSEISMKNNSDLSDRDIMIQNSSEMNNLLDTDVRNRSPRAMDNFEIKVVSNDLSDINYGLINDELDDFSPIVYPINLNSYEARYKLGLDDFFFMTDIVRPGDRSASAALGHNALYLHCIIQEEEYINDPSCKDTLDIKIPDDVWDDGQFEKYNSEEM